MYIWELPTPVSVLSASPAAISAAAWTMPLGQVSSHSTTRHCCCPQCWQKWEISAVLWEGMCLVIDVLDTGRSSLGKDGLGEGGVPRSALPGLGDPELHCKSKWWSLPSLPCGRKTILGRKQVAEGLQLSQEQWSFHYMKHNKHWQIAAGFFCPCLRDADCGESRAASLQMALTSDHLPKVGLIQQWDHLMKLSSSTCCWKDRGFLPHPSIVFLNLVIEL